MLVGLAVALIAVVAVLAGSAIFGGDPDPPPEPPLPAGLLAWEPRGELIADDALAASAADVWRAGVLADGQQAVTPDGDVHQLWADVIGLGRVVVLQALGADGKAYVAQVAEHGDPAVLSLDAVDQLPSPTPVLAITYDGNLDMPGITPGENSALVQVLRDPGDIAGGTSVWRYRRDLVGGQLEQVETKPTGMTKAMLQLDRNDPRGTPLVLTSISDGRSGVARTLAVRSGELVPQEAAISLRDDPTWGPTGRVDPGAYADLLVAADAFGSDTATGWVAAVADVAARTSLVVITVDGAPHVVCVTGSDTSTPVVTEGASTRSVPAEDPAIGAFCATDPAGPVTTVIAAARPGAGDVAASVDGAPLPPLDAEGETGRFDLGGADARASVLVAASDRADDQVDLGTLGGAAVISAGAD